MRFLIIDETELSDSARQKSLDNTIKNISTSIKFIDNPLDFDRIILATDDNEFFIIHEKHSPELLGIGLSYDEILAYI